MIRKRKCASSYRHTVPRIIPNAAIAQLVEHGFEAPGSRRFKSYSRHLALRFEMRSRCPMVGTGLACLTAVVSG